MKKISVLLVLLLLTGCSSIWKETDDSKKFKQEYEALNGELDSSANQYLEVKVNKANPFNYLTYEETMDFLENGTGILLFSRPGCPYCRATLDATITFAKENNIKRIFYFNPEVIREENGPKYKALLEKLDEHLNVDTVTQKETDINFDKDLKRLVVPHMFFVNEGKVVFEYQENRSEFNKKLTKNQEQEIIDIYTEGYEVLESLSSVCNKEC